MRKIDDIHRSPNLDLTGNTISRQAARAIIQKNGLLLMVYSPVNRDYKFPGGGILPEETHAHALARELLEECGAVLSRIKGEFVCLTEYDHAKDSGFDIFKMDSYYYLCEIENELLPQKLETYEKNLGFTPRWISIPDSLHHNERLISSTTNQKPGWLKREVAVLRELDLAL